MSAAPMALGRTPDCYPSPSGLGSRLADGPPGLDEVCSQRQPFHSQKDNLDKSVSGEATTRPEQGVTWAFKYELALSSSKRVGAWEAKNCARFSASIRENQGCADYFDHRQCTYCRCILPKMGDSGGWRLSRSSVGAQKRILRHGKRTGKVQCVFCRQLR